MKQAAMSLEGKRVLFVAPRFFGYERDIAEHIRSRGAEVDWLPDRPYDTAVMAALTKALPQVILPFADRLYARLLNGFSAAHYDIVLVINGQTLSHRFLKRLRADFPRARFILYMWDSLENRGRVVQNFPLFDDLLSFDPLSVKLYGMRLRPLFYSKSRDSGQNDDATYDTCFVGTAHSDRYSIVSRMRRDMDTHLTGFWYLYLQSDWLFYVYRMSRRSMKGARKSEFEFVPLGKDALEKVFAQSRSIIDIEHPLQRGLTMRTFETLGFRRKIITTNAHIRDYDFYNPSNICVIDRDNPNIPQNFFDNSYEDLKSVIYEKYSISGWTDEIFGLSIK